MAPDISKVQPKSVTENDLEHFRQEWRAEVELRKTLAQQLDDHSDQASNANNNTLREDDSTQTTTSRLENVEHLFRRLSLSEQFNRETSEEREIPQQEKVEYDNAGLPGLNQQNALSEKKEEVECDDVPRTALEYYVRAVANEREGNLNEAIKNYSKATTLDPDVEHIYRNHFNVEPRDSQLESQSLSTQILVQLDSNSLLPPGRSTDEHGSASSTYTNMTLLLNSFHEDSLDYIPLKPNRKVHIAKLPNELIVAILKALIFEDVRGATRCALVCKKFCLLSYENSVWRFLCEVAHCGWNLSLTASNLMLKNEVLKYNNNWRRMFIERPRIRYDGVYISRCAYPRAGSDENAWTQPIHVVIYHRFLRFYADGSCTSLLTTKEPKSVVYTLGPNFKSKQLMAGQWVLDVESHIVSIELRDLDLPNHTFYMTLELESTHRGKHNKLLLHEYTCVNNLTNSGDNVKMGRERPFFFSRVATYPVGW